MYLRFWCSLDGRGPTSGAQECFGILVLRFRFDLIKILAIEILHFVCTAESLQSVLWLRELLEWRGRGVDSGTDIMEKVEERAIVIFSSWICRDVIITNSWLSRSSVSFNSVFSANSSSFCRFSSKIVLLCCTCRRIVPRPRCDAAILF